MEKIKADNMSSDEMSASAGVYHLLAWIWLREADVSLLEHLSSPPLYESFKQVGGLLPERICDKTVEELAVDYCQIFIGPKGHLPPFQSVWQSGQFHADPASSMKKWAEAVDYQPVEKTNGMMLDHLGSQLDLMGHILEQGTADEYESQASGSAYAFAELFYNQHLAWPTRLLDAAIKRAESDFYRSTIQFTRDFLQSENSRWLKDLTVPSPGER